MAGIFDNAQPGGFQQIVNPSQMAPQQTPPSTPQELEQRKSGWEQFMHKLQNDPATRTAAFMTAAQLMRGPDMGESMAGGIGRAIQLGTMAHSFMQGNQAQQQMELQRLEEERRRNASTIQHQQAQTEGLRQAQDQSAQQFPLAQDSRRLKNAQDQFTVDNQELRFMQENETANTDRVLKHAQADYYRNRENSAGASTRLALDREDKLIRTANPPMAGESPEAYEQRIAQMSLSRGQKNENAVRVQALQKWLSEADPSDPNFSSVLDELRTLGLSSGQSQNTSKYSKTDFEVASLKAKNAGKTTFVGPDGVTYKVK